MAINGNPGFVSACPICRLHQTEFLFEKNNFKIINCFQCEIASVEPMPTPDELASYYDLGYFEGNQQKFGYVSYIAEEPYHVQNFFRKAEMIRSFERPGKILDGGCATGTFLEAIGPEWHRYGVEISDELLKAKPPPAHYNVWCGDFLKYPAPAAPFDVVTFWDVLDHVRDPKHYLRRAGELLKPGGLLALHIGDRSSLFAWLMGRRWHIIVPPTHLYFFTRKGMTRLLRQCGFDVFHHEYEARSFPLDLCFFRLSYIIRHPAVKWIYEKIKSSPAAKWSVRFNLRDVMTLYARKR
ncbi:MAG: class I SAM-dependent methyltransferase [Elusimicrobia bacterium]|nr:class I SAM-dependent methyltransferase [Elusimicrobiota bacterium]